jgi:glycosyltransferase involved in cell wall biosynthesis
MTTDRKYKILTISDDIRSYSGVALQMRFIIEHLIKTGKFQVISICVSMKVDNPNVMKTHEYGDDLLIVPATRYDDVGLIRQIIDSEKSVDAMLIMTDPRFYNALFSASDEIRRTCPILYNSIWDNFPVNWFLKPKYDCIDFFGCINKVMFEITKEMGYHAEGRSKYIPHGVPEDIYKPLETPHQAELRKKIFGEITQTPEFVVFYNSRNALRKRTGNVLMAYKIFLNSLSEEDRKKVFFCMHSPPHDPEGQNLIKWIEENKITDKVAFSAGMVGSDVMNEYYNMSDVTIIQSSEEGFGLSGLESLMAGTPVLAGRTGGIQDYLEDKETGQVFGIMMEPDATSNVGNQEVVQIESHHFNYEKTAKHLRTLFDDKMKDPVGYKDRWAGKAARESMLRRFNLNDVVKSWESAIIEEIEKHRAKKSDKKIRVESI